MFRDLVIANDLEHDIYIDSSGTGDWHIGRPPDQRATEHAAARGVDLSDLRARLVIPEDFGKFDYVLAMDRQNLADLNVMKAPSFQGHLGLFLDFAEDYQEVEVPDPYYGGGDSFELVLDMVQNGCEGLLQDIRRNYL
ncbi:UNVERIFIED_CONTAM: hypothetical protein GTU68_001645 [Idotea baltica]|nr:hypothetical protein [Idotea baltica]